MLKNETNGSAPQRMTEAISDYENALREFSTSAAEFLKQVPLLNKAREAYARATTASTQLRGILDKGDETLHRFMAQLEETITLPHATDALDANKPESETIQTIKADEDKAEAARA